MLLRQFKEGTRDIWQGSASELALNCIALGFAALRTLSLDKAFLYTALKIALNMDAQSCKEVSSPGHLLPPKDCNSFLPLATQTSLLLPEDAASSERGCVMLRKVAPVC